MLALLELIPYSWEELQRRLRWCKEHRDPAINQIAIRSDIDPSLISRIMHGKEKPSPSTARILTDFFHKWDAGIYVMYEGRLIKTRNPKPRTNLTVDWRNPKIMFKTNAEVVGLTWLGNAINHLELLGSSENICVSPTETLKPTKKSARKGVPR
jgi:transcriptional regulator with XRE-family HTH domain